MLVTSHALKINDHFNSNTLSMAGHVTRGRSTANYCQLSSFQTLSLRISFEMFCSGAASLSHSLLGEFYSYTAKLIGHKRQLHCCSNIPGPRLRQSIWWCRQRQERRNSATGIISSVCWNLTPSVMSDPDSHFAKHRIWDCSKKTFNTSHVVIRYSKFTWTKMILRKIRRWWWWVKSANGENFSKLKNLCFRTWQHWIRMQGCQSDD